MSEANDVRPGSDDGARPALRIVRGEPGPEEIAALTALLARSGGDDEPARVDVRGSWRDPARLVRSMPLAGPNAWRSSGW